MIGNIVIIVLLIVVAFQVFLLQSRLDKRYMELKSSLERLERMMDEKSMQG